LKPPTSTVFAYPNRKCLLRYPTLNLPDWVKERHRAKSEQELQQQSPSTSSQKIFSNIRDYFNPPSPRFWFLIFE
uniref:Uncharacterized protein n=1 Tax=Parascaris equorum TaxID=6256 RepID=A0A914SAL1_PAREQ